MSLVNLFNATGGFSWAINGVCDELVALIPCESSHTNRNLTATTSIVRVGSLEIHASTMYVEAVRRQSSSHSIEQHSFLACGDIMDSGLEFNVGR